MLVLTRKPGESVAIGEQITVTVLRVRGEQVSLGVEAPKSLAVWRDKDCEILTEIKWREAACGKTA